LRRRNSELVFALLTIILITAGYSMAVWRGGAFWSSGSLGGHLLGVVGFVFMLLTELLYSTRKHAKRAARWGRMDSWLKFHIYTGLVGPYMVLLHTSWKFNGIAGVVTLLTLVIVLSGFIGRYIYTAIPRTAEGLEMGSSDLESQLNIYAAQVKDWTLENTAISKSLLPIITEIPTGSKKIWWLLIGRLFSDISYSRRWSKARQQLKGKISHDQIVQLNRLVNTQRETQIQQTYQLEARRLLALWHTVHVPIGITLFILAFIHVGAAIYYVTLAR
jgi:hypothetical protein